MATNQYIGARYVPLFADPAEWNSTRSYEPLTIVLHEGNSYTSKQYVPVGKDISDADFWALTGDYNSQVEQYRKEVKTFDGRITTNASNISAETARAKAAEKVNADAISAETARAKAAEKVNADATTRGVLVLGDSWSADKKWTNYLAQQMHVPVYNYSVSGASYSEITGSKGLFSEQADTAKKEGVINIDTVIIYGGLNDVNLKATPTAVGNACASLCKKIHTYWPNVRILTGFNCPKNEYVMSRADEYCNFIRCNSAANYSCYVNSQYWLVWINSDWDAINFHPGETGKKFIAALWKNALSGGETLIETPVLFEKLSDEVEVNKLRAVACGSTLNITGYLTFTATVKSQKIFNLQCSPLTSGAPIFLPSTSVASCPLVTVSSNETYLVGFLGVNGGEGTLYVNESHLNQGKLVYVNLTIVF